MKRALFALSLALLGTPVLFDAPAHAQVADHTTTPLMVIRFNQPRIYFERPLYNAVSRALQAKPGVTFNLVNYVPARGADKAQRDLQAVLRSMNEMGVPPSRISVDTQTDPALRSSEVHLYVR